MTDRELLEMAAKAAGYDVAWNSHWKCFQHRYPKMEINGQTRHPWVPLEDDGDALRLAVELRIQVDPMPKETFVGWGGYSNFPQRCNELREFHEVDAMASTRRAIVRAAAEIGRTMP